MGSAHLIGRLGCFQMFPDILAQELVQIVAPTCVHTDQRLVRQTS